MGQGCSVLYHPDWRFFEFNVFRNSGVARRHSIGLYRTVMTLYSKERNSDNLLDDD
jgi:hypothetical protein